MVLDGVGERLQATTPPTFWHSNERALLVVRTPSRRQVSSSTAQAITTAQCARLPVHATKCIIALSCGASAAFVLRCNVDLDKATDVSFFFFGEAVNCVSCCPRILSRELFPPFSFPALVNCTQTHIGSIRPFSFRFAFFCSLRLFFPQVER